MPLVGLLREKNKFRFPSRLSLLKISLSLALLSGFFLSIRLWVVSRSYPLTPVSGWLPEVPPLAAWVWFVSLLLLLGATVVVRRPRGFIIAFIVLAGLLSLFDQSRWQPWFYQYLFMFAALALYPWGEQEDPEKRETALNICRLIVASTYFWSGVQKLNVSFVEDGFPEFVDPLVVLLPESLAAWILPLGILVPFMEAGIGIGLLTRRFRNAAVVLALGMHAFILFSIGPFGRDWNTIIWPWNLAMMAFVVVLFWRNRDFSLKDVLVPGRSLLHGLVLLLFGIMPLLSFFGLWDSYLSASLYSHNTEVGAIYVSERVEDELPAATRDLAVKSSPNGTAVVSIIDWSFGELNVPPYMESRVFENVARHVCGYAENPREVKLLVTGKPTPIEGTKETRLYGCSGLETGEYEIREPA